MRAEALVLLFSAFACNPETPEAEFTCDTACENLRELRCEEADETPEGATCEDVCENSFEVGIELYEWDLSTLTQTKSCEQS